MNDLRICPFLGIVREEGRLSPCVCRKDDCMLYGSQSLECHLSSIYYNGGVFDKILKQFKELNKELKALRASL